MADRRNSAGSRNKASRSGGGAKTNDIKNNVTKSRMDLLSREEEYKRLNEELEAKTADLVREAEEVMRGPEAVTTKSSILDNINADDFLRGYDDDNGDDDADNVDDEIESYFSNNNDYRHEDYSSEEPKGRASSAGSRKTPSGLPPSQPSSARSQTSARRQTPVGRGGASARGKQRPRSGSQSGADSRKTAKTKPPSTRGRGSRSGSRASDVAILDDDAFLTNKDYSLQDTITNIEDRLDQGLEVDEEDDVMPSAAAEMGAEAQIRFLKAKLRVMQEEMDKLADDCHKKDTEITKFSSKVKELEEERHRLARTGAQHQTQMEKFRKMADDGRAKSEALETQLNSMKKELDSVTRNQKQQATSANAVEVRLNRAQEDVEKYKAQLAKARESSRDTSSNDKKKIEQLLADNKRLEKQKNELMAGFKKQIKLIDILKRQKMHIEAAKMLSFTEEEFVKALEWNN